MPAAGYHSILLSGWAIFKFRWRVLGGCSFELSTLRAQDQGHRSHARVIQGTWQYSIRAVSNHHRRLLPQEDLVKAFRGQDAIVNAITNFSVAEQLRFIDAAITAGVKRFVPSEYGLDNNTPEAQELAPVFKEKGLVQTYLREKESSGLTWTAIACGMWTGWSLRNNFLGLDYPNWIVTFTDDGTGYFSTTTLANTAQKELVEPIGRLTGEIWQRKSINTEDAIPALKAAWEKGDAYAGYGLINIRFTKDDYSGHFEPGRQIRNEGLGLPERSG
ncbi:hypothetical protein ETB97_001538 [Aspergillus alliaceus]|uniref:NmrA-like domain-containing protein n=1 Tax=Petromyces alliaceus TaxID=209559 RepID=A0A8H6AEV9_PETAA|nr:hypothetical protein ETB97_001538 [Aspergillus burnettii]